MRYPDTDLYIDGAWQTPESGKRLPVLNPATGQRIGMVACAGPADLDRAAAAAERGFRLWRRTPAIERGRALRRAAALLRERVESVAAMMTLEQGKPLAQARIEILGAADTMEWFAEEATRAYGRIIPARAEGVTQMVAPEPVGPVAAFAPWNFPVNQSVRKLAIALAAGCSVILKAPEETPASPAALVRALHDAGVPAGVIGLVYGIPAEISAHLIAHPAIRKVSFTGSTPVGKQLAALAGARMKRMTMELGGHAPAIVFADADLDAAAALLAAAKLRNAGQVCTAPTRFLIQRRAYEPFLDRFMEAMRAAVVGDGMDPASTVGPLAHERRLEAMAGFMADARARGAEILMGGERIGERGSFFAPAVVARPPSDCRLMNEEPFGPVALAIPFDDPEQAIAEANRLPYGLAAYGFTRSLSLAGLMAREVEAGMLTINHLGLALPEAPFGGMKESGYGSEGGADAIGSYLNMKFVTQG